MTAADPQLADLPGPRMRCYPVDGGRRWAAALKSASGQLETLAALFSTEAEATAYVATSNEALAARGRNRAASPHVTNDHRPIVTER